MPVLRDIPIALTPDQVFEAQKPRRRRRGSRPRPAMAEAARQAIDLARSLYAPAIVYTELAVQEVEGERVALVPANGSGEALVLKVGPHADLLAPARRVLVAVYTLGPALEERVSQLNASGETMTAYWLDTVGVMALGAVGETVRCIVEEKATARGWGVSASLSPGSLVGWPLQGQRALCALLPLAEIGVQLNRHYVLEPHKSVSTLIGMGPDYASHEVGSVCHFCALADSCWRRR